MSANNLLDRNRMQIFPTEVQLHVIKKHNVSNQYHYFYVPDKNV